MNRIVGTYFISYGYFSRMKECESYNWLMESHGKKIESELNNLYSTLGQFHNLSETIIQHALTSSDCKVIFFHYIIIKFKI